MYMLKKMNKDKQSGNTLIMVMLLLILAAIMGLIATKFARLDEVAGRNTRDRIVALQAAESALRDARNDLIAERTFLGGTRFFSGATGANLNCPATADSYKGFYSTASGKPGTFWSDYLKDNNCSIQLGEVTARTNQNIFNEVGVSGLTQQPRYLIEALVDDEELQLTSNTLNYLYKISAVGYGRLPGTEVMVQEVVRIPVY